MLLLLVCKVREGTLGRPSGMWYISTHSPGTLDIPCKTGLAPRTKSHGLVLAFAKRFDRGSGDKPPKATGEPTLLASAGETTGKPQRKAPGSLSETPLASGLLPDQRAEVKKPFQFQVPDGAITDPEGEALSFTASLADGSELPSWLKFDAGKRKFAGTPPEQGAQKISIAAKDPDGNSAETGFMLTVSDATDGAHTPSHGA